MKVLVVTVTKDDIENGSTCSGHNCPIARAICRKLNAPGSAVFVEGQEAQARSDRFVMSKPAQRFVERFDEKKPVKPATFRLKRKYLPRHP